LFWLANCSNKTVRALYKLVRLAKMTKVMATIKVTAPS
jgi:hypothetical protein